MVTQHVEICNMLDNFRSRYSRSEPLVNLLAGKYSLFVANMLADYYDRGTIVVEVGTDSVYWKDSDGTMYNIRGIVKTNNNYKMKEVEKL